MKLDLTVKPVKLIGIVIAGLAVFSSIVLIFRSDSLTRIAGQELKNGLEDWSIPYKDIKIETLKNDGIRATIEASYTVQTDCTPLTPKVLNRLYLENEKKELLEKAKSLGFPVLTDKDGELLQEMGLYIDDYYGKSKEVIDTVIKKWKRCYSIWDYTKSGDKWKRDIIEYISIKAPFFLSPPNEQEKLGYKITDEMRKKVSENPKSGDTTSNKLQTLQKEDTNEKDEDISLRNTAVEFYNASARYYGLKNEFPWKIDLNGVALSDSSITSSPNGYISLIIDAGELKKDFIGTAGSEKLSRVFVTSKANSQGIRQEIAVCFLPKSNEFKQENNSKFDKYGTPKSECSTGDKSGKECYWCIK